MIYIILGCRPSLQEHQHSEQGQNPKSENSFDLTQKMHQLGFETDTRNFIQAFLFSTLWIQPRSLVSIPQRVRIMHYFRSKECVDDRQQKEDRGHQVQWILADPAGQLCSQGKPAIPIRFKRHRNRRGPRFRRKRATRIEPQEKNDTVQPHK